MPLMCRMRRWQEYKDLGNTERWIEVEDVYLHCSVLCAVINVKR